MRRPNGKSRRLTFERLECPAAHHAPPRFSLNAAEEDLVDLQLPGGGSPLQSAGYRPPARLFVSTLGNRTSPSTRAGTNWLPGARCADQWRVIGLADEPRHRTSLIRSPAIRLRFILCCSVRDSAAGRAPASEPFQIYLLAPATGEYCDNYWYWPRSNALELHHAEDL